MARPLGSRLPPLALLGLAACGVVPMPQGCTGTGGTGGEGEAEAEEGAAVDLGASTDGSGDSEESDGDTEPSTGSPATRRYVALMEGGAACVPVEGWNAQRLFHLTNDAHAAWGALELVGTPMPAALVRFCVYTWAGSGHPPEPPAVPNSVRVDPDPDIVVPQGPAVPDLLGPQRSSTVLAALGASAGPPPASSPYLGEGDVAYVAVVDTADSRPPGPPLPSYAAAAPRQRHGLMMGSLVQQVRCPHADLRCTSRQFFAQAFPYDATTVEPLPSGGQTGSLASLASAIGESVARWRSVLPATDHSPLVINLSVGWDVQLDGTLPATHDDLLDVAAPDATVPATVQAVHHALAWAACEGALSLAASGNARGALCEQQSTMAPAAWEALPAPSALGCSRLGITLAPGVTAPKLAYGVGGLDPRDEPIANTRLGSMPSRALFSYQASVEVGAASTDPWTGTSIATAASSAIAAQVWSYRPTYAATQVLRTLDDAGVATPLAEHWQGPAASTRASIQRIDAQSVLAAITPTVINPYVRQPPEHDVVGKAVAEAAESRPQSPPSTTPVALVATQPGAGEACGALPLQTFATADPQTGSPSTGLPSASPATDLTRPQPHVPICPNCPIARKAPPPAAGGGLVLVDPAGSAPEYTFYLAIDPSYADATVTAPVLSLYDPATTTTLSVGLGQVDLSTATSVSLHQYSLSSGTTVADWIEGHPLVRSGRLSLSVDDDGSGPAGAGVVSQVVDVVR